MNKILFSQRHELTPGKFLMKFSCSDLLNVDTELSPWARSSFENEKITSVQDRITLSLQKVGYELESVSFRSMSITAIKK